MKYESILNTEWWEGEEAATFEMDVRAALRRAGFKADAAVADDTLSVRIKREDWERFRTTLLKGASAMAEGGEA